MSANVSLLFVSVITFLFPLLRYVCVFFIDAVCIMKLHTSSVHRLPWSGIDVLKILIN